MAPPIEYTTDVNTKLLIHFNGVDEATAYTAETGQTVTFAGNSQLDTAKRKYGTASLLCDGDGDYVTVPDESAWDFGTGDFTIDTWFYVAALSTGYYGLFGRVSDGNNYIFLIINKANGSAILYHVVGGTGNEKQTTTTAITNFAANTWYHIAVVRSSGVVKIYINGVNKTGSDGIGSSSFPDWSTVFSIGRAEEGVSTPYYWNGGIDTFRISNVARWTTDFSLTSLQRSQGIVIA